VQPVHGEPLDMDGDGDIDVVMSLGMHAPEGQADSHQVVWYENVGKRGGERRGRNTSSRPAAILPLKSSQPTWMAINDPDIVATAWGEGWPDCVVREFG